MRVIVTLALVSLSACGPDVSSWTGVYRGSATINAGRQPEPLTGTLTANADATFTLKSDPTGTMNRVWQCSLRAASAAAENVTFMVPTTCALGVMPDDGCMHQVTINMATVHRIAGALEIDGSLSGRVSSTCTGMSGATNDWLLEFSGRKL